MMLLYKNLLFEADLLATNEDTSFPISNVVHKFLMKKFQVNTSFTNSVITCQFLEDKEISSIAIGFHNANTGTYYLYDSSDVLLSSGSLSLVDTTDMTYFTLVSGVRKVVLDISSSVETLRIGGISVGDPLYFPYHNTNPRVDFVSDDIVNPTEGGQITGKKKKRLRRYRAVLGTVTQSQFDEFLEVYDEVGNVVPFYYDLYEGLHEKARPIYSVLEGDGSFRRYSIENEWTHTVVAKEAR